MFQYLRSVWIWTASAFLVVLWVPVLGIVWSFDQLSDKENRLRSGRWFRRLGRMVTRVNPWRLHITGSENIVRGQVYVVVSNHQSLADIPLLSYLPLDTKWLAKVELFRVPVFGWLMKMAGDVPVDRHVPRQGAKAMLRCAKYLRQKVSVVFFPEGGRSPNGEVQQFNEGAFQLAIREKIPVLPIVVEGTGSALPSKSWLWGPNADIQLRVLQPVAVDAWGAKESAGLRDAVRQIIIDELARLRQLKSDAANIR